MGDSRDFAPAHSEEPARLPEPPALRGIAGVIGNQAMQRLAQSPSGPQALRVLARDYEMSPSLSVKDLNLPRQTGGQPDFSRDTPVDDLGKGTLDSGDHVWYWEGRSSTKNWLPQQDWFKTTEKQDYKGQGPDIYNFVIYPNHVKCGQPHMKTKSKYPGSFAWLNNNPGNLSGVDKSADIGQYLHKYNGSPPDTPNFMVFPTPEAGYDAIPEWLATNGKGARYIDMSIRDAWHYYDQSDEERYVALITQALGVPDTTILRSLNEGQWTQLKAAIKTAEGTVKGWTYDRDDWRLPPAIRKAITASASPQQ